MVRFLSLQDLLEAMQYTAAILDLSLLIQPYERVWRLGIGLEVYPHAPVSTRYHSCIYFLKMDVKVNRSCYYPGPSSMASFVPHVSC